jgi:ferrous iron transport protein A
MRAQTVSPANIAELSPGEGGLITQVAGSGAVRQRLLDLGLLPGTRIELERVALSGDPLWIRTGDLQLSLRRKEAFTISIRPVA